VTLRTIDPTATGCSVLNAWTVLPDGDVIISVGSSPPRMGTVEALTSATSNMPSAR
jgi:hypothetical protein